jgi:hypothetical protein
MPPTPHNDLHPAARDHAQKEGRKEGHCDLRVKHCHCPRSRVSGPVCKLTSHHGDLQEGELEGAQPREAKKSLPHAPPRSC